MIVTPSGTHCVPSFASPTSQTLISTTTLSEEGSARQKRLVKGMKSPDPITEFLNQSFLEYKPIACPFFYSLE